jgi:hypothetical protein
LLESGNAINGAAKEAWMRPDLSDPAAKAGYSAELRGPARRWRLLGFALILTGVAALFYLRGRGIEDQMAPAASWAAIGAGWAIFIAIIAYRTGYHEARMAGD